MHLRNTQDQWGLVAVTLHWLVAVVVMGLFALGLYMTGLDYYDPWYHRAPEIHKGIGVLLFGVIVLRTLWRRLNPPPAPLPTHTPLERRAAMVMHHLLYGLLWLVPLVGYLIPTADGRPVAVFGWFEVPALGVAMEHQEDVAGDIHLVLAVILIALAAVHAAGALKHHFLDRDRTLRRMFGG